MATIEIDGKTFEVENGKMIIEVADEAGIPIPRFCYHKKLSVAANCRMCLVEIENNKKTVPACATPVNQGMKVFTQSANALKSQKAVMEFLLINHPLDCPICDQGGECELQDVSMGYGRDDSDFSETKRSVDDKNLGSLISTEMTRCIHCTRCVRFGEEIAGLREMGSPYRGENVQIGTYVESSLKSEISGNIIDICPVGALTSKPYRYTARSWELKQKEGIAPHDCLGSNIYLHSRREQLMRVVPKECESINETWLSDKDRFSYTAVNSEHRLAQPMIKRNGHWESVDWSIALNYVVSKLGEILAHHGPDSVATFASPSSTTEEFYILQKWMRALKVKHIDHRLRQVDFDYDKINAGPIQNSLDYARLEEQQAIFIVGCNINREVPLAAAKVRKASLNGTKVHGLNMSSYQFPFQTEHLIVDSPIEFVNHLMAIVKAMNIKHVPKQLEDLHKQVSVHEKHQLIAESLRGDSTVILTGNQFENHPYYSKLRILLSLIVDKTSIKWIHLSQGANSLGAWNTGFVPNVDTNQKGMNAKEAIEKKLKAYILHGVEPSHDFTNTHLTRLAMKNADFVCAISAFKTEDLLEHADVLLPMATFAETSGTYTNLDGLWQSFEGAIKPYGKARPAWKIYRVLANLSQCDGFEYLSSDEVLAEAKLKSRIYNQQDIPDNDHIIHSVIKEKVLAVSEIALYGTDMIVRHSKPLQDCAAADIVQLRCHPRLAEKMNLSENVTVSQNDNTITLPLELDDRLDESIVVLPSIGNYSNILGGLFEWVSLA
jgi:NADH-quinone oxidoreductase subunit G